jgi:hypothetical protein
MFICISLAVFFSCAGFNPAREETASVKPERPEHPARLPAEIPELIMGEGQIKAETLALFLEKNNPRAEAGFVRNLADCYVEEAAAEGIHPDAACAQMCLVTGFLQFGGLVTPVMNNFCGLGAIGPGQNGERFGDPRTGVRAHIQHLKAYATNEPLNGVLVDPRYKWVRYGSAPDIYGLSGTWAADKSYGEKIAAILRRLYEFSFDG